MHNIRVKRLETSTLRFKMEGDDCIRLFPVIGSSDGFKLSNAQHLCDSLIAIKPFDVFA